MDAPTLGVLRDTALLVWLALLLGVILYQIMRVMMPKAMTSTGKVQADSFISADALIVAAITLLLLSGLQTSSSTPAEAVPADDGLTVNGTLAGIVVHLGLCMGLLMYLNVMRGLNLAELFGLRRLALLKAAGLAVLLMLPTLLLVNGSAYGIHTWMEGFWPDLKGQDVAEAFRNSSDPLVKGLLIVAAAIVAPLVEEIVFRGFIYGVMKRYTDGIFAALCSSLLFAIVHLHVGTLFPLALLALVFCAIYERTGSLVVPMIMHALFNATSLAVMIFFPDIQP
jgi:membrane protease YdiL (CAAX protease family)